MGEGWGCASVTSSTPTLPISSCSLLCRVSPSSRNVSSLALSVLINQHVSVSVSVSVSVPVYVYVSLSLSLSLPLPSSLPPNVGIIAGAATGIFFGLEARSI